MFVLALSIDLKNNNYSHIYLKLIMIITINPT